MAYVNRHAGFVLDLPDWLSELIEEVEASNEYAFQKALLQEAFARAQGELEPEILAELSYRIARVCRKQADAEYNPKLLTEALLAIKPALQTYTRDQYPYQYAKTASLAGYLHFYISDSSKRPGFHTQQALTFYEEAASIWTREAFADLWFLTQKEYVDTLLKRYQYSGEENDLDRAQNLAYELLFSGIPDEFDTLAIALSLIHISFIRWSHSQDGKELEYGLNLASMVRDFALSAEHRAEFRSESAALLMQYGAFLGARYLQTREKESLEQSIKVRNEALELALSTDPLLHLWRAQLSLALLERYLLDWQAEDLAKALSLSQQVLNLVEVKEEQAQEPFELVDGEDEAEMIEQQYAPAYFAFGYCLLVKNLQSSQPGLLNQAIIYLEKAVKCTPRFSPDLPIFLTALSDALVRRQETAENLEDVQRGIVQVGSVLQGMRPGENVLFSSQLYSILGLYLSKRHDILGDYQDIIVAVEVCRYALYDVVPQTALSVVLLTNLAALLRKKYAFSGNREDLEEAIDCCTQALDAIEETSQFFPFAAFNLAAALQARYRYNQDPELLDYAVTLLLSARERLAANTPLQGEILMLITDILQVLYASSGNREYIDLAITVARQMLDLSAPTYPRRYIFLCEYFRVQASSYALTGEQEELQAMLETSREALKLMPQASPYRTLVFSTLSESLYQRYERTGSLDNLDQALVYLQKSIDPGTLSTSSVLYPSLLDYLGRCYLDRYRYTEQPEDLEAALKHLSLAVAASTGSSEQGLYSLNLARARLIQALEMQRFEDLEQILKEMRGALSQIKQGIPLWQVFASILVQTLCITYEMFRQREYLEEAIELITRALDVVPHTAPERVSLLVSQGRVLRAYALLSGQEEDEQKARASFEEACEKGLALSPESALNSAAIWGRWAEHRGDWDEAGRAYGYAIRALDLLYREQVSLTHKRQRLTAAKSLDTLNWNWVNIYEQAAYALARAGLFRDAVTSLERGRAREMGERLAQDRANLRALEQEHAELHQKYLAQISHLRQLENTDLAESQMLKREMGVTSIPLVEQIRQARAALTETIEEIRQIAGHADFQLDPGYEQIAQAASPNVPLVYIVVTTMGSLALLVPASGGEPEAIWAEELKPDDLLLVKMKDGNLVGGYLAGRSIPDWMRHALTDSLPYIGECLLQRIAQRLHTLKATGVVLIPTGSSGVIPFHAAPYSVQGREDCLLDHFDVSYAPSARVLVTVRNEASKRRASQRGTVPHLLGVGNPLPAASEGQWAQAELRRLLKSLQEYINELRVEIDDQPPPEPLLDAGRGIWAQEELERLSLQVQEYVQTHSSSLHDQAPLDPELAHIFIASWERALQVLQVQSDQSPEKLIEQGLSFFWWANYFGFLAAAPDDLIASFSTLSLRIPPALPFTRLEMEGIQKLFTARHATTFYGSQATRDALWKALPEASILHLSCHASFRADKPLDSAFLLAQNTNLSLRDLLEADEKRLALLQLAVLPACQTAVTDMQTLPNEVIGLFAGFLHTGVPSVIGTLWSVEQMSAALLMIRFYDLYLSGADASPDQKQLHPATALRLAQCWLRDQTYKSLEVYTAELRRRGLIQLAIWVEHYLRVALTPQKDEQMRQREEMRPYAHFYDWAAFVYYGA